LPTVEILYPAKGCREKFVLLVPPPGTFEYNPVAELKGILTTILDRMCPLPVIHPLDATPKDKI
jgi:H3 lysine-79-specific histone-lysine N-methyltransferase